MENERHDRREHGEGSSSSGIPLPQSHAAILALSSPGHHADFRA